MDDLTLRYYDAEMRYLLEVGEEFARAHPDRAALPNLDKSGARAPYVEAPVRRLCLYDGVPALHLQQPVRLEPRRSHPDPVQGVDTQESLEKWLERLNYQPHRFYQHL